MKVVVDHKKYRGQLDPRKSLVPMIDVVFLLLVYFVTTYSYNPPESDVAPALEADRAESGSSADFQVQIVDVGLFDGELGYRVGTKILRDQESLESILRALPKEGGVFVRGSDAATAGWAVAALQASRDAGFGKVTYVPGE
ncbi:MAG: biopolymer transporter ExbD [Planctomycetota bacterium]